MANDIFGYMDAVDFAYELGCALGGNVVYSSIEDLRKNRTCVDECGIVKVRVTLHEVVAPGDFEEGELRKLSERGEVKP